MEQIVECVIAGGPQHGLVRRQLWDSQYPAPPVVAAGDGEVCIAAASRPAGPDGNYFLLLHPRATGAQIVAMIGMLCTMSQQAPPLLGLPLDADYQDALYWRD